MWVASWLASGPGAPGVGTACAADVKIEAPKPAPEPRIGAPDAGHERRPGDETSYPMRGPVVPYDPAFIYPFVIDVGTPEAAGHVGLSGWTSPSTPVGPSGAGLDEISGWLGFGLTWTWGGPHPPLRR